MLFFPIVDVEGMATDLEDDTERITPNEVSGKTFHFHPESDVSEAEKLFPNKDKKVCSFTIFQSCNLLKKRYFSDRTIFTLENCFRVYHF